MVGVAGWDACIGYSAWVGKKHQKDSPLVRLLRDAGAVPFVKTNLPMTLLSFESHSDVFGRTTNPHKKTHSPGGSTGGEAALLAYGGSRIGIGTDVAGSLRVPAHYSGIYSIRASAGRFMKTGISASMPGQEGIPQVCSPMARTLEDLETFWKAVVSMEPWKYDQYVSGIFRLQKPIAYRHHTKCLVMPWRNIEFSPKKPVKWGVMWDDGTHLHIFRVFPSRSLHLGVEVVAPSPACRRALETVVNTLQNHGHDVVSMFVDGYIAVRQLTNLIQTSTPPSPYEGLKIAAHLLLADGGLSNLPQRLVHF